MATLIYKLLCYSLVVAFINAETKTPVNNTIFADKRNKGEAFEHLNVYRNTDLLNADYSHYRLPTTTRPVHYNVFWKIDTENSAFSGTVEILLVATQENVNEIVIHSAPDLTRTSTILMLESETIPVTVEEEPEFDFIRIKLNSGNLQYDGSSQVIYSLTISFASPLRTDMHGIYINMYDNTYVWDDGSITGSNSDVMVASQFKTTYARYAMPCYDEPKFKATFDVVISRPSSLRSWFCSRINRTRSGDEGYEEDVFRRTPPMSTYLLAIVVARFSTVFNNHDGDRTWKHELIKRSSLQSNILFVFEYGYKLIEEMSKHTGIDYYNVDENMKTMTHALLPDFAPGATANWGLIISREVFGVYDQNHVSDHYRQLIASITGNQIAHMWFGSIVTNELWDYLWLTEGFARYYQYFLTHWVDRFIKMGLDTRFITEQVHTALLSDSADNPHPLTNPNIGSPASIDAMFSTITCNKGASVIRMTEHLLGFEVHRQGLQNYLRNRYLDTAVPNDLFQALQEVAVSSGAIAAYGSDFSFIDYYRSWTEKSGHPVLYVHVNHQTGDMIVQQRRFNINTGYSTDDSHWIIPITFATAANPNFGDTKPSHIISQPVTVINRGIVGDNWVIFNKQQTGFYRVNYDEYTWNLIVLALRGEDRTKIHEYNRAQIVDDVFQFARSGIMSYTRAFNILSFLENETEYAPWVAAMTGFTWLRERLAGTSDLALLDQMIVRWATPIMTTLTYNPVRFEPFLRSYLRWQLAPFMCAMNVRACRDAANTQFRALVTNSAEVPVNSRHWVYCNGLREGSESDFDFLWQRYQHHTPRLDAEKLLILESIGCTPHASRINSHLNNIVQDNDLIRKHDSILAFNSVLTGNEDNALVVFAYIRENLSAVINAFGSAAILSNVAARLRTLEDVNEFQDWVSANQNQLGDAYQTIVANAELTRQSIAWATQVRDDMNNYFVNGDDTVSGSTAAPVTDPPTVTRPELVEPETPDIPDSAVTASLSIFSVIFVGFINAL